VLPLEVEGGVKVLALGSINKEANFSDKMHLWPEGYCTEWRDPSTGSIFICDIRAACG
jgi:hypothetical protein